MALYTHLIAGGGMAAGYAVQELIERGVAGAEIGVLSLEPDVPYERPPLSKEFLRGETRAEDIAILPAPFYEEHEIGLHRRTQVMHVHPAEHTVVTDAGDFQYRRLLLATGARARTLDVPGADLKGIHALRTREDSETIRRAAQGVQSATVVGAGFIGMEVAASLTQSGVSVTQVFLEDRLWQAVLSPEISDFFAEYYTRRGVTLRPGVTVTGYDGEGVVAGVDLSDGSSAAADLVVLGVGVDPVTGYLAGSGIDVDDGVLVNEYLETSAADVWAAGDVARYQDPWDGRRRRVEHWNTAVTQGQHVARAWAGERTPYDEPPYFFSDVFDLSYEFWGDASDADEVLHRAEWQAASIAAVWLKDGRVVAAFVMDRPDDERELLQSWVRERAAAPAASVFRDPGQALAGAPG